ncbi:MAG: cytochrome c, partial [Bacteroidota bacterium]
IKLWINMGATNSTIDLPCDSSKVTFSGSVKPIFTTWCVGCHNSTNPGKGIDLTNYESVIASVNSGQLLGSIKHDKPFIAMPQNTDKLSDCDIAKIAKWIREGAVNN